MRIMSTPPMEFGRWSAIPNVRRQERGTPMIDDDSSTESNGTENHDPSSLRKPDLDQSSEAAWALAELASSSSSPAHPNREAARANRIEWVRPTDLAPRVGGEIVNRGAQAHRDAHAWARARLRETVAPSDRKRRLPPPSAFGNNGPTPSRRDGIGL